MDEPEVAGSGRSSPSSTPSTGDRPGRSAGAVRCGAACRRSTSASCCGALSPQPAGISTYGGRQSQAWGGEALRWPSRARMTRRRSGARDPICCLVPSRIAFDCRGPMEQRPASSLSDSPSPRSPRCGRVSGRARSGPARPPRRRPRRAPACSPVLCAVSARCRLSRSGPRLARGERQQAGHDRGRDTQGVDRLRERQAGRPT